jgi:hypothetical protein
MAKYAIIENAKRQIQSVFVGIAIPTVVEIPDSQVLDGVDYVYGIKDHKRYLATEKVLKFNRSALRNSGKSKPEKVDPRVLGDNDSMIVAVGEPGSRERVEALCSQYEAIEATNEELSPFGWDGD